MKKSGLSKLAGIVAVCIFALSACSPEVGSEKWCEKIKAKATGDLTANEVSDFAKYCIFKEQ
jgi:hypothetical protein